MARDAGLDLVMVSPQAQPPVCKILDFGKFKYLTEKQEKEKKRTKQELKGIKMRPGTAANDRVRVRRPTTWRRLGGTRASSSSKATRSK